MEIPINIIITEDQEKWRNALREHLRDYNVNIVAEAANGIELLELLATHSPDIILLDLSMPKMNGNDTMTWLTKKYPTIKVIIYSFFAEQELIEDFIDRGAKGYASKQSTIEDLVTEIQRVYRGGLYIRPYKERNSIQFTSKNKNYITLLAEGKNRNEIASELNMTPWGVDRQKKKVMNALEVDTHESLLLRIISLGFNFFGRKSNKENKKK